MATAAPTPAPPAKPSVPAPAVVAPPVAPAAPDPPTEMAQLSARLAQLEPASDDENKPTGPETIDMSGMVLEKSVDEDGQCTTKVLKQPMINPEMIRATKAVQRQAGF